MKFAAQIVIGSAVATLLILAVTDRANSASLPPDLSCGIDCKLAGIAVPQHR